MHLGKSVLTTVSHGKVYPWSPPPGTALNYKSDMINSLRRELLMFAREWELKSEDHYSRAQDSKTKRDTRSPGESNKGKRETMIPLDVEWDDLDRGVCVSRQ